MEHIPPCAASQLHREYVAYNNVLSMNTCKLISYMHRDIYTIIIFQFFEDTAQSMTQPAISIAVRPLPKSDAN